jgi:hypothetical protein
MEKWLLEQVTQIFINPSKTVKIIAEHQESSAYYMIQLRN